MRHALATLSLVAALGAVPPAEAQVRLPEGVRLTLDSARTVRAPRHRIPISESALRAATLVGPNPLLGNLAPRPYRIADGDRVEVVTNTRTTVSFWFASPERTQTTAVTVTDDEGVVAAQRIGVGAATTVELDFMIGSGLDVGGTEYPVVVTATDDGTPSKETVVRFTVVAADPPAVACDPTAALSFDRLDTVGQLTLYEAENRPFDLGPCTFVVFDPTTGAVRSTVRLTDVLAPHADTDLSVMAGDFPPGTFTLPAGAFALVRGTAAVGDALGAVLGSTDFVLGAVYDRAGVYGNTDGNLFSHTSHPDPAARQAAFEAAVSRWLGVSP